MNMPRHAITTCAMLAIFAATTVVHADTPSPAVLLQYTGDVKHRVATDKDWTAVNTTNLTLNVGAEIQTAEKSEATVKVGAYSIVTLRELTFLRIKSVTDDESAVDLDRGRVITDVQRKSDKQSFSVKTPAAVAGVRGTMFIVETDADNTTSVTVGDGTVAVTGNMEGSRTVKVEPGFTVKVVFNKPPEDPRKAELIRMQELQEFKKSVESFSSLGLGVGAAATQMAEQHFEQLQQVDTSVKNLANARRAEEKMNQDLAAIKEAFKVCFQHTGYVPQVDDGKLDENVSQLRSMLVDGKSPDGKAIANWKGPYIEGNLKDPFGRTYKTRFVDKRGGRFEFYSLGQNIGDPSDDPVTVMLFFRDMVGPDGQPPAKPAR
jgi:hypothetical protein